MKIILVLVLAALLHGSDGLPFITCAIFGRCQQVCTNQLLGYKCSCHPGFSVDPKDHTKCIGPPLICQGGYEANPFNNQLCQDIDECVRNKPCEQLCTNTQGGYTCSCRSGYHVNANDRNKCKVDKEKCPVGYTSTSSGCVDINECTTLSPCDQNCFNYDGGYRCSCRSGYEIDESNNNKCSKFQVCTSPVDIILVLDSSGSMGADNNVIQLAFASKLADHFEVGSSKARFGALVFSDEPELLFDLNTYKTSAEIANAIRRAPFHRGVTRTDKALNYIVNTKKFGNSAGGRSNAPDIVIVFTDGQSDRPELTEIAADNVKGENIRIISVGIGKDTSPAELITIASSKDDVYQAPTFELLDYIEQRLTRRTCPN